MDFFKSKEEKILQKQLLNISKTGENLEVISCKKPIPVNCIVCVKENNYQMVAVEYSGFLYYTVNFCSLKCLESFFGRNNINFEVISKGYFYSSFKGITVRIDKVKIDDNIKVDKDFFKSFN